MIKVIDVSEGYSATFFKNVYRSRGARCHCQRLDQNEIEDKKCEMMNSDVDWVARVSTDIVTQALLRILFV
jgi:hypothetical protein